MRKDGAGFYAVIPATILRDDEIPPNAKLLYADISALTLEEGYCYAENDYLMGLYRWSERTVQRLIRALEGRGYIRTEQDPGKGRRIYLGVQVGLLTPVKNVTPPPTILSPTPDNFVVCNKVDNYNMINTPKPPKGARSVSVPKWDPEGFEKFWAYYRSHARGENRAGAVKAWDKLQPNTELKKTMGRALMAQLKSDEWRRGVGIPHAATWINNRRWEDVLDKPAPPGRDEGEAYEDRELL